MKSPDGRNQLTLHLDPTAGHVHYTIRRDQQTLIGPSSLGLIVNEQRSISDQCQIVGVEHTEIDNSFELPFGKNRRVHDHASSAEVSFRTAKGTDWVLEMRAYNDGVAFRYRLPKQPGWEQIDVLGEQTQIDLMGKPSVLFNTLKGFETSHESLYSHQYSDELPFDTLIDMPMVVEWDDAAVAITEARVRDFAGAYLRRINDSTLPTRSLNESTRLRFDLAPLPKETRPTVSVRGATPITSPWRVFFLADRAGECLESDLLACLNDPPEDDFEWLIPGKTTWHWWAGEFEQDHRRPSGAEEFYQRHLRYIDFCADNGIAYHAVSGDGLAWYQQSPTGYGRPATDADVRHPRPELRIPEIIAYAKSRGVGIRLWVHWKPLSEHLEEALALYRSWGVRGLMVDFLNRDHQPMIRFTERLLRTASKHHLHIQIHGSSKFSGEQRTFPHLFNREGVLNLEACKWSDECTPQHNVNVAYARGITGPVDYHLGGFRSATREGFVARNVLPEVLGTRGHHLALYVVLENPLPMIADAPQAYRDEAGFDFLRNVPTTWDETRFVTGEVGKFLVIARRKGQTWFLAGITNWEARELKVPLSFLTDGPHQARIWIDDTNQASDPNDVKLQETAVNAADHVKIRLASGGGFAGSLVPTDEPAR